MQIFLESPYDEYINKLIETGHFQNAEQVVQFALNDKFQLKSWDETTIPLIEAGLKDIEEGRFIPFNENYKNKVIEAARQRSTINEPIPDYLKP